MEELERGGELVKVLYATLGRRPTKAIVWVLAAVFLIWGGKTAVESIDWLANRFAGTAVRWGVLLDAVVAMAVTLLMLVILALAFGIFVAIVLRLGIDRLQKHSVSRLVSEVITLLEAAEHTVPQEQSSQLHLLLMRARQLQRKTERRRQLREDELERL